MRAALVGLGRGTLHVSRLQSRALRETLLRI